MLLLANAQTRDSADVTPELAQIFAFFRPSARLRDVHHHLGRVADLLLSVDL
jgi:hypothetical protein